MAKTVIPEGYKTQLDYKETNKAIKFVKDIFQQNLQEALNLTRVSAPLFVDVKTGLNDTLNGIEAPVSFNPSYVEGMEAQVVHSLAKWKRYSLGKHDFKVHTGIYADMNAIRKDEELDNIHSLYVDQWDWEVVITKEDRTVSYLQKCVENIYSTILKVEHAVLIKYPFLVDSKLPEEIKFLTSQELLDMYPDLESRAREDAACKEFGAVFLMKIGDKLSNGQEHDGRAPDYDDWELNGDILVWNETLKRAYELSSMGIRVDSESLKSQLEKRDVTHMATLPYHSAILNDELPYTIGGGIGQSRLCMYFLRKIHIGEVQSSIWDDATYEICEKAGLVLL
ncbi:aspartate--ammonia ligase [Mollicutes bacterium LVI A0039]|nr:aspartate--ammonia ligase [Mollicutes bacterium LVI A0039]